MNDLNQNFIDQASHVVSYIQRYHRHKVIGVENLPKSGPAIIVVNHSLATYDIALLNNQIYKSTGRVTRALMDRWFFKFEAIGNLMHAFGAIQGTPDDAKQLLIDGEMICVAPGGMLEAIRSSSDRYQICWDKRKGFARLAIEAQVPVLLAACPKADDIFDVFDTPLTSFLYERFRLPFLLLKGLGPTPLPKPVQLTHMLSKPIVPPSYQGDHPSKDMVDKFHRTLVKRMRELMGEALTSPLRI
jgi:1-acyl-sn-glycerol-3-phosphate acyltransferase